jgi:hypothetical protein
MLSSSLYHCKATNYLQWFNYWQWTFFFSLTCQIPNSDNNHQSFKRSISCAVWKRLKTPRSSQGMFSGYRNLCAACDLNIWLATKGQILFRFFCIKHFLHVWPIWIVSSRLLIGRAPKFNFSLGQKTSSALHQREARPEIRTYGFKHAIPVWILRQKCYLKNCIETIVIYIFAKSDVMGNTYNVATSLSYSVAFFR